MSLIKRTLLSLSLVFGLSLFASPALVLADAQSDIQCGVNAAAGVNGCTPDSGATGNINSTIKTIINLLSVLVGIVAVVMIVVAGFKYITSAGDSNKVSSAKSTLLYAIIGLVLVALAQIIVKFVLNRATK